MRDKTLIDKLHAAIDKKFAANEHKGTWRNMSDSEVLSRMVEEIDELSLARANGDHTNAIDEAADVALFAVFYADPQRGL